MTQLVWVEDEVVLAIHDEQLCKHGGLSGVKDMGEVLSALARPRYLFDQDESVDLAQLTAAYIYGIARNHGFADGNKRTSLVVGDVFLMLNGYELTSSPASNVLTIIAVADGTMSEEQLTKWVRENIDLVDN